MPSPGDGAIVLRGSLWVTARVEAAPELECYAKVCRNCAYTDFYSAYLIDEFEDLAERAATFGEISQAPGGQRLLSIFVSYEHRGEKATNFTVPIPDHAWFALKTNLDELRDDQLVELVLPGPYKKAWVERVGPLPADFAKKVWELVRHARD